jgi:trimeric autotransporter adhesin
MASGVTPIIVPAGIEAGSPFNLDNMLFVTNATNPKVIASTPSVFVDTTKTPNQILIGNKVTGSTLIGQATETAPSTPANHVVIGTGATTADGQDDVIIGRGAQGGQVHTTDGGIAIGPLATVGGPSTNAGGGVAIGSGANGNNGVAIGAGASCVTGQVAVGASSRVTSFGVAVGGQSTALFGRGKGSGAIAVGRNATASESTDVVISANCNTAGGLSSNGGNICVVGSASSNPTISGFNNVMIGGGNGESLNNNDKNPNTGAQSNCILIGGGSVAAHDQVILLGRGITSTAANQCVIGGSFAPVATLVIGNDVVNAAPQSVLLMPTGGLGSNAIGGTLTIAGGIATGSGVGGSIVFRTSQVGGGGAAPQVLATALTIDNTQTCIFANAPKITATVAPGLVALGALTNAPTGATPASSPQAWGALFIGAQRYVFPLWTA